LKKVKKNYKMSFNLLLSRFKLKPKESIFRNFNQNDTNNICSTHFSCRHVNCRPCDVVENEDDLNGDADQDAVLQGPKEASEESHEAGDQVEL